MILSQKALAEAIRAHDASAIEAHFVAGGATTMTLTDARGFGCSPLELAAIVQASVDTTRFAQSLEVTRVVARATPESQQTAALVKFASENADVEKLRALLAAGVLPQGEALHRAAGNGCLKNAYWLLKAGARAADAPTADLSESMRELLGSATGGTPLKTPYALVDLEGVRKRARVWVSWLESLASQAKDQTFYAVGIDGSQLVANTEEALAGVPEQTAARRRFSFGDWRFRSGFSPKVPASEVTLDESALAPRAADDDRLESELLRDLLWSNREVVFRPLRRSADFRLVLKGHPF